MLRYSSFEIIIYRLRKLGSKFPFVRLRRFYIILISYVAVLYRKLYVVYRMRNERKAEKW